MELTPDDLAEIKALPAQRLRLAFAYVEAWRRYRALLHVLSIHLDIPAERLEREADEWIRANQKALTHEAKERLDQFDRA
jgi:hypothetical protein